MNTTTRNLLILSTVIALAPVTVAAQEGNARIEATMEAAARAGIPASLLESKLKEGRAKGVAEGRIAGALETRLDALLQARDAMREAELETVTAGELSVAADAIQAGVSGTVLAEIARTSPQDRRLVATAVLTSLVELGLASEQARDRVHAALVTGPQALANLHAEVAATLRARGGGGTLPPLEARGAAGGLIRINH